MNDPVIYRCEICGNLLFTIDNSGVIPTCCGEPMTEVTANTEDAVHEKHVPVIRQDHNSVAVWVGAEPHPMSVSHRINFVVLVTDKGAYVRTFSPGDAPEAQFILAPDESVEAAYAWCNLHGLWKG